MWTMMAWNIAGGLGGVECKNHESARDPDFGLEQRLAVAAAATGGKLLFLIGL